MAAGWIKYGDDVPADLRAVVEWATPLLGLEAWRIWVTLKDTVLNDDSYAGSCDCDHQARIARIELQRDATKDPLNDTPRVVLHELLHAVLSPIDLAVNHRIITLLPEDRQAPAKALYTDGLEPVINELAGSLRRFVPTTEEVSPDG